MGVPVEIWTSEDGKTPLELVGEADHNEAVKFCIENWNVANVFDVRPGKHPPFVLKQKSDGTLVEWDKVFGNDPESRNIERQRDRQRNRDFYGSAGSDEDFELDETISCQRCGSHRVASASSHGKDLQSVSLGNQEREGYLPDDMGIGGDDDLVIEYCLDCGQLQGTWPLPPTAIETGEAEDD